MDMFSKYTQISNFVKIRPIVTELFPADGQTDTTKLTAVFRNFSNSPKNDYVELFGSYNSPHENGAFDICPILL